MKGSHRNQPHRGGLLARLLRDSAGNAMPLLAAALVPLLAMVGGGIDMGRSYLAQSRLQQACDAGVLAARKKLGSATVEDADIPEDVGFIGERFFNINFRSGAYGTVRRNFTMTLEEDYAISGVATVEVPTSIMNLFGYEEMPITVACQADLNFSNTDIMFVLDSTGSMKETNPSDTLPRIEIMRSVVKNFYTRMESSKSTQTRLRYGFVPYSTNVNVGGLLKNEWVVGQWTYQSRENAHTELTTSTYTYGANYTTPTGTQLPDYKVSTYDATHHPALNEYDSGSYSCDGTQPADTYDSDYDQVGATVTEPYAGPPAGNKVTQRWRVTRNGIDYWTYRNGTTCEIWAREYNNHSYEYDYITIPKTYTIQYYRYAPIARSVTNWRTQSNGCMEERSTYQIDDWDNVDFTRALDLDIDTVPTSGDSDTQWRPMYPNIIYERKLDYYGTSGSFSVPEVTTTDYYLFKPAYVPSLVACPAAARKLAAMNEASIDSYLASITPTGTTYHDIGMIWGGRLLSPTGLFADENANVEGKTTNRHLIFLTDGDTESFDVAYGAYGVEPLDQRRWDPSSTLSLDETVEKRFSVACDEVKKRNITVWVVGFGTEMTDMLKNCAGNGRWFEADDAAQLSAAFDAIASSMGDLRISK